MSNKSKMTSFERMKHTGIFCTMCGAEQDQCGQTAHLHNCEFLKEDSFSTTTPDLPALLARCREVLQEVSAQKAMVRAIEQYEDYTGGEPSLGTCKTFGQLKTIADKASTLLADFTKAGVK